MSKRRINIYSGLLLLAFEALVVFSLVLWAHSLRNRFGLTYFYAILGGLTAVMSWVTDTGAAVEVFGLTFMIGSTVFYTSLLLGVFVVYVFDGPVITRTAIFTIAGVSVFVPVVTALLHFQNSLAGAEQILSIPIPSLRVNSASVIATVLDLVFLGIVWEFLGKPHFRMRLWLRAFLTLLGVMWIDVLLFSTGAFLGTPLYLSIIQGNLIARFIITLFAFPLLYYYISWQNRLSGVAIKNRPVLSIVKEVADIKEQLSTARQEIILRKKTEKINDILIEDLQSALNKVKKLEGFISLCASCRRVKIKSSTEDEEEIWISMERFIRKEIKSELSHGICPDCAKVMYPDLPEDESPKPE